MNTSFFGRFFADEHIKIICRTLIHSLWIGLIAAVIAGAVLLCTKRSSSHLRYRLLCLCLIIFVLITGFVFYQEGKTPGPSYTINQASDTIGIFDLPMDENSFIPKPVDVLAQLSLIINRHSVWIFTVWFLCFTLKSLGLIGGLFYVHRIRTYKVHPVGAEWKERMEKYSQKIGVNQSVRLVQSELVKIPVTVGHFKPLILIPIGLIFQLPALQIETILMHELAHIKRRDYLVNLIQSLLETIFFFNPGLLWLSSLIKQEREICCDDIVLANTASKSTYLEALLAFHTKQPVRSGLALGIGSNQLASRLKRIINHENKRLNKMEKIILLAGLLIVSAFSYMPNPEPLRKAAASVKITDRQMTGIISQEKENTKHEDFPVTQKSLGKLSKSADTEYFNLVSLKDTMWKFQSFRFFDSNEDMANRDMEVRDDKDNLYRVEVVDGKVISLKVNNVQVPQTEMGQYEKLLEEIDKSYFAARESKRAAIENAGNYSEKMHGIRWSGNTEWDKDKFKDKDFAKAKFKKYPHGADEKKKIAKENFKDQDLKPGKDKLLKIDKEQRKEFKKNKDTEKHFKLKDKNWKEDKKYRKDKDFFKTGSASANKPDQLVWAKDEAVRGKGKDEFYGNEKPGPDVRQSAGLKKKIEPVDISADQQRVRAIIAELVQQNVISKSTDLEWFGLSEVELMVNGNRQPAELQQKLKEKYDIKAGHGLYFGPVKMTGKGVFLDKENL